MQQRNTAAARGLLVEQNSPIDDARLQAFINKSPIEDHYELERDCFARGKFAQVRRIRHKRSGHQYAAKTIKKRRPRNGFVIDEIHHEIRVLLLSEQCSGIVKLIEVFEASNEYYLVLELAKGGELQQILDEEEVIEEQVCRRIMRQIIEGLHFLHQQNVAHLDIKPQNILLTDPLPKGEVRLCDFGISRIVSDKLELREIMGTTDYMAPETLNYEPISLTTDIWSVGVVAYSLLSGLSPFGGDDRLHTYSNITSQEVEFPDDCFGHISALAKDFIIKCLNKDKRKRINCEEALKHEWLIIDDVQTTTTITDNVSEMMEQNGSQNIDPDLELDCSTLVEVISETSQEPDIEIIISDLDCEDNKENQPQIIPPAMNKFTSHKRFSSEIFNNSESQKLVAVVSASGIDITSDQTESDQSNVSSILSSATERICHRNIHDSSDTNNNNVNLSREIPIRFLSRESSKSFTRNHTKHETSPPLTPNKKFYLSVDDNFADMVKHSGLFNDTPLMRTRSVSMERLSCSGCSSNGSSPTMGVSGSMFYDNHDDRTSIVCQSNGNTNNAGSGSARVISTSMSSLTCHLSFHHLSSGLIKHNDGGDSKGNNSQCSSSNESLSSASSNSDHASSVASSATSSSITNGQNDSSILKHLTPRSIASDCH